MNKYYPTTQEVYDFVIGCSDRTIINSDLIEKKLEIDNVYSRKALSTLAKDGVLLRMDRGKYIIWKERSSLPLTKEKDILYALGIYFNTNFSIALSPVNDLLRNKETKQISKIDYYIYSNERNKIAASNINKVISEITNLKIKYVQFWSQDSVSKIISEYFNFSKNIERVPDLIKNNFNGKLVISSKLNSKTLPLRLNKLIYGKVSEEKFNEISDNDYLKSAYVIIND